MTVTIDLQPNQVVYVGQIPWTYDPSDENQIADITKNIKRLIIMTSTDTMACTTNLIPKIFIKSKSAHQYGHYIN